jgi:hypothetical protein
MTKGVVEARTRESVEKRESETGEREIALGGL